MFISYLHPGQETINTANTVFYNHVESNCGSVRLHTNNLDTYVEINLDEFSKEYDRAVLFISNLKGSLPVDPWRFVMELGNGKRHVTEIHTDQCLDRRTIVLGSLCKRDEEWEFLNQFKPYPEPIQNLFPMLEHSQACNAAWLSLHCDSLHGRPSATPVLAGLAWLEPADLEEYVADHYAPHLASTQGEIVLNLLYYRYKYRPMQVHHHQLMETLISDGAPWWKCLSSDYMINLNTNTAISLEIALKLLVDCKEPDIAWATVIANTLNKEQVIDLIIKNRDGINILYKKFNREYLFPYTSHDIRKDRISSDLGL